MPPLGVRHKLAFGVGQMAEGFKSSSFETFLFFYYNQVLGLPGTLAGLAVFIALLLDAASDPIVGSISDRFRSRWGRRHPFMYAAAVPLGLAFYFVFTPPAGLGEWELFGWLTTFAVLVRQAMSVYSVPHLALGAELSDEYHERTSIVGWRTVFGVLGAFCVTAAGFFYFFRATPEFPRGGQLDASAYSPFGLLFAIGMVATVLYSAAGTHARIPHLPRPPAVHVPFSLRRVLGELLEALSNPSFRMLFVGIVVFFVMRGVQFTLGLHMNTYFWQITPVQIGGVATLAVVGLVIGVPFWTRASRSLDKKPTFLLGIVWFSLFAMAPPVLQLVGVWPGRDDPRIYVGSLAGMSFLAAFGGAAALIAAGSMMADLTDEHELSTGRRQEGIFFGALTFAGQSASGLGHQIAGLGIDLISFPAQALPGEVAPAIVRNLGILYGPGIFGLAAISLGFMSRYSLTRERLHRIQAELLSRRAAAAELSKVSEPLAATRTR